VDVEAEGEEGGIVVEMTEEVMPMTLPLEIGVEIDLLAHPLANLGEETGEAVLQGSLHMEKREMPMKVKGRLMEQVGEIQLEKESLRALQLVVAGNLMEKENLLVLLVVAGTLMEKENLLVLRLAAVGTLMEKEGILMVVEGIPMEKGGLQLTVNMITGALMETEKSMLKGMIERCHIMLKSRENLTPTPATLMPVKLDLAPMLLHLQSLTNLLQTTRNGKNGRKDKECNKINSNENTL